MESRGQKVLRGQFGMAEAVLCLSAALAGKVDWYFRNRVAPATAVIRKSTSSLREGEARQRESEELPRQITENIQEVFWMADPKNNRMLYISAGYEKIWGRSCESLYREPLSFLEAIHPQDRDRILAATPLQVSGNYDEEYRIVRPDGDIRWIRDRAFPVPDESGRMPRIADIAQDITERRFIEAELIQAAKMATLGEMATGVAHELNQPLNIIRMAAESSAERIEDRELDCEWLRGKLERISRQTARAAAIIDHMRIFGRKADETPVEFHLRDVIEGALGLIGAQLRLLDIEIEAVFPKHPMKVLGHAVQLEQVILNLLSDARHAIEAKGRDRGEPRKIDPIVEDLASDNTLRLIVSDTSCGIPETALAHIFEPFYTTKEIGKGTGLGLSVSYGIITDMGGTLEAVNTQDGAQFTITLPAA